MRGRVVDGETVRMSSPGRQLDVPPPPAPPPRRGRLCWAERVSRERGDVLSMTETLTCHRWNDNLLFPHPRPLPRGGVGCVWRSGSRGRGLRAVDRETVRVPSPGRQLDVPPPPAPPPRRGWLCWAERVSRERGDGSGIWLAKFSLKLGTEHLTPPRRRFICTCDTRQPLVNRLTGHCHVDNTPCRSGSTFAGPG
jgi:hypothetical protein